MPGELWLVRHAMPELSPRVPPHRWRLSGDGRAAAQQLHEVLPQGAYAVSSPEPKAMETLSLAGFGRVILDDGFAEVVRDEVLGGDFHERRRAYLDGEHHPGWEDRAEVVARFDRAVRRARLAAAGRPVVVGTHGMAMTLWLSRDRTETPPSLLWDTLECPDVLRVEP